MDSLFHQGNPQGIEIFLSEHIRHGVARAGGQTIVPVALRPCPMRVGRATVVAVRPA